MMRRILSPTRALSVAALGLLLTTAAGGDARAGMENLETGERCWGSDCWDPDGAGSSGGAGTSGGGTWLANVETHDCKDLEAEKIVVGVRWLQDNLAAIDAQMGRNGLMAWPGNSRANFEQKLSKQLKFYCINDKNKCEDGSLRGIVHPVVAQKRINLCTQNMRDDADARGISRQSYYIHLIAHEIGHLVRINAHRSDCRERFSNPRFSQALGLAAEAAHRGVSYDADQFLSWYCPTTAQPDWQDIIEDKQHNEPPLTMLRD
jgi:hypothetical protein